jgi:Septum formation inhibitor
MNANIITIKLKKDEIHIELNDKATYEIIIQNIKEKVDDLEKFYKDSNTPIIITGKELTEEEFEGIRQIIKEKINVTITYMLPESMGLHSIKGLYEKDTEISETKYYRGSLRSGQKIEYNGSMVVLGDVNGGAEIVATDNIVVIGALRGLAHAGAKGNKKAFIAANVIDTPQFRIATKLKSMEPEDALNGVKTYAYINEESIIVE